MKIIKILKHKKIVNRILGEGEVYELCGDTFVHTESVYTFPESYLEEMTENDDYEIIINR